MKTPAHLLALFLLAAVSLPAQPAQHGSNSEPREKVVGIGGFFFRSTDPKVLAKWYLENLGIDPVPKTARGKPWKQEAGTTIVAPFPAKTDYFGDPKKDWMLNFRVKHLDALVKQLQAAGITVKVDPQTYPNGRFAHLSDPEGNPLELWEPAGT